MQVPGASQEFSLISTKVAALTGIERLWVHVCQGGHENMASGPERPAFESRLHHLLGQVPKPL